MGKENYITIAKAIGISLMVVGHSGCPAILKNFIYYFHMPLFFFCSGYFFHVPTSASSLLSFCKKRVQGLYIPYIKWSLIFLALHNLFFLCNIYNESYGYEGHAFTFYSPTDFLKRFLHIVFSMDKQEPLLGGFWFLKTLFISSLLISCLFYIQQKLKLKKRVVFLLMALGLWGFKYMNVSIPIIGEVSIHFMGGCIFLMGFLFHKYEKKYFYGVTITSITFALLLIFSLSNKELSMFCTFHETLLYLCLSLCGIIFTFNISKYIEKIGRGIKRMFYYMGQNTMIILALHFMCFKVISLLYILLNGKDITLLSSFPTIESIDNTWWIFYSFVGIGLPLLLKYHYDTYLSPLLNRKR